MASNDLFSPTLFCREEVRLLREELTEEYEADKQAALTQLSQQKELEMMAAREGWQRKVEDLLEQVKHIAIKQFSHWTYFFGELLVVWPVWDFQVNLWTP